MKPYLQNFRRARPLFASSQNTKRCAPLFLILWSLITATKFADGASFKRNCFWHFLLFGIRQRPQISLPMKITKVAKTKLSAWKIILSTWRFVLKTSDTTILLICWKYSRTLQFAQISAKFKTVGLGSTNSSIETNFRLKDLRDS